MMYLVAVYVHIVTVAMWFGAMLFEDPASVRITSRIAHKIRGLGGPSLVILFLTGGFMLSQRGVTIQNVLTGQFFANSYGRVFGLKFLIVLVLITFQITIGNRPSRVTNFGYILGLLSIIALSVWLVRPVI